MKTDINAKLIPTPTKPSHEDPGAWLDWESADREAIGAATAGPYRAIREASLRGLADGIRASLDDREAKDRSREAVDQAYEDFKAATAGEPNSSANFRIAHAYYSAFKDGYNNPERE